MYLVITFHDYCRNHHTADSLDQMAHTSAHQAIRLHIRSNNQHSETPVDVFELFFSDDLLDMIVEEFNRYAAQVMGD